MPNNDILLYTYDKKARKKALLLEIEKNVGVHVHMGALACSGVLACSAQLNEAYYACRLLRTGNSHDSSLQGSMGHIRHTMRFSTAPLPGPQLQKRCVYHRTRLCALPLC